MEDVVKYLADIIEFLVGGVLFLASLLLVAYLVAPEDLGAWGRDLGRLPASFGLPANLVMLAFAYAFGVMAEGMSRLVAEWRLNRLTTDSKELRRDRRRIAHYLRLHCRLEPDADDLLAGHDRRCVRDTVVAVREQWRADVLAHSPGLAAAIDGQLKRLRIERTFLLTSMIASTALLGSGHWYLGLLLLLVAGVSAYLVDERFKRYLGIIVRAHTEVLSSRAATS